MKILITGAANGIGKETAKKLANKKHQVIAYDHDKEALEKLPENIETIPGDVRNLRRTENIIKQHKDLQILVNCAGYQKQAAIEDITHEQIENHIETNYYGPLNTTKSALPILKENQGKIVNISSIAAKASLPFLGPYSASKKALEGMSETLRLELHNTEVDVVTVEPGRVKTGFNEEGIQNLEKYLEGTRHKKEYKERLNLEDFGGIKTEKAAEKLVKIIESDKNKPYYTITKEAYFIRKIKPFVPQRVWNYITLKMI